MHKKILEMIENVDPEDTDTLDEIDARVWCWLASWEFESTVFSHFDKNEMIHKVINIEDPKNPTVSLNKMYKKFELALNKSYGGNYFQYTRSDDAQETIIPKGWSWYASSNAGIHSFVLHTHQNIAHEDGVEFLGEVRSTKYLAKLHAIIQARAYIQDQD